MERIVCLVHHQLQDVSSVKAVTAFSVSLTTIWMALLVHPVCTPVSLALPTLLAFLVSLDTTLMDLIAVYSVLAHHALQVHFVLLAN